MEQGTKVALSLGSIVLVGAGLYWLISKRSEKKGNIISVSKLTSADTFHIYPVADSKIKVNNRLKQKYDSSENFDYKDIKRNKVEMVSVGDTIVIRGGKGLSGKYKVLSRGYLNTDPTKKTLVNIKLKNDGQWDGKAPTKDAKLSSTKQNFWFKKAPTFIVK
tara:strand:+ start:2196 stop:2681 length:486 start_codon:yes stop_codon:yes gene_type:complete